MVTLLVILASLFSLVKFVNIFIDQASSLAKKFKVSDFVIGFTVVAFGTSLPELTSTLFSTFSGHSHLVMSNIIGSNIANVCLVLGTVALFNNFRIRKRDVNINIPLNMAALMVFWALAIFTGFSIKWASGILLILIFFVFLVLSKSSNHFEHTERKYIKYNSLVLISSLIFLVISGKICIDQTINLSNQLKISETILGYFLLAVGTSLPELITTWIAVKKHDGELGIGNILGSNLFNLLFILGISTFIRPLQISDFKIDLVFLTGITLAVYLFAVIGKKYSFSKKEGLGLLLLYVFFILFQIFRA